MWRRHCRSARLRHRRRYGPFTPEHALFGQIDVDLLEDPLGQGMLLQQMAKAKQRGRFGKALDSKVYTDEATHGLAVVDSIFKRLIGKCIPLL